MDFPELYFVIGLGQVSVMGLAWLISLPIKNATVADAFWGLAFISPFWSAITIYGPHLWSERLILLAILVTIWGFRLGVHIMFRNWGKPEDFRYAVWRKQYGSIWWYRSFWQVFVFQGVLVWILSAPLIATVTNPGSLEWIVLDGFGFLVWLVGFFFEAVGDWQLMLFREDPANRGKLLTTGLWRYTRHPNYFGEAAQWWGFWLLACSAGNYWTLFSPLLMTFLLLYISGVRLLEKSLKETKPGYEEYVRQTSEFFPLPPLRENENGH